jgi:hypothetical protein
MVTALLIAAVAGLLLSVSLMVMAMRHVRESRARVHALKQFALGDVFPVVEHGDHDVFRPRAAARPALDEPAPAVMFAAVEEPAPPARRWMSLAAVASAMLGVITIVFLLNDTAASAPTRQPEAAAPVAAPIALVALHHTLDRRGLLTIDGQVSYPPDGRVIAGLVASVTTFDAQGRRLATQDARLDASSLMPGAVGTFSTTVRDARNVARYEVAFGSADGGRISHVDRR